VKTRTQIHLAIGLGVMALALLWPIHDLNAKPMVECKDGKCVIDEADWQRYREFHIETKRQMHRIDAQINVQNALFEKLMGDLTTCQSRTPQKEV
jgi:hypothetical protein